MAVANSLNTSIFPNNGVSLYVSKLNGDDVTGTGSIFSPLASMNAALALCRLLPATYFFINVVDAENYDEEMLIDVSCNIYGPAAAFFSTTGDTFTLDASGIVITGSLIQSTGGNAVLNNSGYPIINFNASFAGNFVNDADGTIVTLTGNTLFGSVTNTGAGSKTVMTLSTPIGGSADVSTFGPWYLTLTPIT